MCRRLYLSRLMQSASQKYNCTLFHAACNSHAQSAAKMSAPMAASVRVLSHLSVCLSVCLRVCVRGSAAHTSPVTSLRLSIKYRGERCLWWPTAGSMAGPGLVGAESRTYIMRVHSGLTVAVLDRGLFDGPLSD